MLDRWRPLRLVLDDATLADDEIALFGTFGEDDELEIWHTRADLGAHLEIGDEFETPFRMGGARSIHAVLPESGTLFGIYGVERLRQRAHLTGATHHQASARALAQATGVVSVISPTAQKGALRICLCRGKARIGTVSRISRPRFEQTATVGCP